VTKLKENHIDHIKHTLAVKRRIARFKKKEIRISRFPIYKRYCFFCSKYFETPKKNKIYCSETCRKLAEKVKNSKTVKRAYININQKCVRGMVRDKMRKSVYFPLVFVLLFLSVSFAQSLNVTLNYQNNATVNITTSNISFGFTPTFYGSDPSNCSLMTNLTGSWAVTQSNQSAIVNNSLNSIYYDFTYSSTDRYVLWGINCSSSVTNYSENRTLRVSRSDVLVMPTGTVRIQDINKTTVAGGMAYSTYNDSIHNILESDFSLVAWNCPSGWTCNIGPSYCYQESPNESTACGGLNTGVYGQGVPVERDENWSTYYTPGNFENFSVNYTIPSNTNVPSSYLRLKTDVSELNISLALCTKANILQLMILKLPTISLQLFCANSSTTTPEPTTGGWVQLTDSGSSLYEEAMWWKMNSSITLNKSNVITLNNTIPWTQVFANLSLQNISKIYNGTNTDTIAYSNVQFPQTDLSLFPTTSMCYQESANVSTSCGGLANGNYSFGAGWTNPNNLIDGDWNTYATATASGYILNITYKKPISATMGTKWQVKDAIQGPSNGTIPLSCWNAFSDSLNLYLFLSGTGHTTYGCYNQTDPIPLLSNIPTFYIYEEAIWWNISANVTNVSASSAWTKTINASGDALNETWQLIQDSDLTSIVNGLAFSKRILNVTNLQNPTFNFTAVNLSTDYNSFRPGWNCSNISQFNINSTYSNPKAVWCNKSNVLINTTAIGDIAQDTSLQPYFSIGVSNALNLTTQITFNNSDTEINYTAVLYNFSDANTSSSGFLGYYSAPSGSSFQTVRYAINMVGLTSDDGTTCVSQPLTRSFNVTSPYYRNLTGITLGYYGQIYEHFFFCSNESKGCMPVTNYCVVNGWTEKGWSQNGQLETWTADPPANTTIYFYGWSSVTPGGGPSGGGGGSGLILCPPGQYYTMDKGCVNNNINVAPTSFGFADVITGDTIYDTLTITNTLAYSADLKFEMDVPWISVSPATLSLAVQKSADFRVALAAPYTNGTYTGNIKVYANNQLVASIPVVLKVVEGNPLESNARILFGSVGAKYLTQATAVSLITFAGRTIYSLHFIILALLIGAIFLYSKSYIPGAVILAVVAVFLGGLYYPIMLG